MKAVLKRKYILISLVASAMLSLAGIIFYMSKTPVKQYPSLSYSFNVPTTEADMIRKLFDSLERSPDIADPIKKMAEIKDFVSYLQIAGKNINEVKFEIIQAGQSVTWQCDIENNVEVKKTLIPESFLILYYGLESYNTGVTLDKIQLENEDHKLILNSARTTMQNYSMKEFFNYTMCCYSRFKIDQIPDDTELTGITIGLWKYYDINKKAELTVIINTQIPAGTTKLVVKNTE